jgi:hypothetical protein
MCFGCSCWSQLDTAFLDLGRTLVRKNFVQGINVKASQLEQLPFSGISGAVSVWFYGHYSNAATLVYVVDGNRIADINVYNLRDLEDFTLVQNAAIQVNGAFGQEQLVVVRTRKNDYRQNRLIVAGQSQRVSMPVYNAVTGEKSKSETNAYHNYSVSAYKSGPKTNYAFSFGYLRDVWPNKKDPGITTEEANHFNRYRLSAYMNVLLHARHKLSFRVNGLLQPLRFRFTEKRPDIMGTMIQNFSGKGKNPYLHTELMLASRLGKNWWNHFSAAYAASTLTDHEESQLQGSISNGVYLADQKNKTDNILLRNTVFYSREKNGWTIAPYLNFTYRFLSEINRQEFYFQNGSGIQQSYFKLSGKGHKFLLTPAVDLTFKQVFNFQAGVLADLSDPKPHSFYPFAMAGLDLFRMINDEGSHLKIFGSYASAGYFMDHSYELNDFSKPVTPPPFSSYMPGYIPPLSTDSNFSNYQAGMEAQLFQGLVTLGYNFEKRDFISRILVPVSGGSVFIFPEVKSGTHRIGLSFKSVAHPLFSWYTGIYACSIKNEFDYQQNINYANGYDMIGDVYKDNRSWTGGWNNRLTHKNLSLGFDLLYHFSRQLQYSPTDYREANLLSLQFLYLGYAMKIKNAPILLFLSGRNLVQNKNHNQLSDARTYLGGGFSLSL